jgi:methionyl-tRNA synthetase
MIKKHIENAVEKAVKDQMQFSRDAFEEKFKVFAANTEDMIKAEVKKQLEEQWALYNGKC